MEYKRISNSVVLGLLLSNVNERESMILDCLECGKAFVSKKNIVRCSVCLDRYRLDKIKYKPKGVKATLNTERYLKLHNGDIYDCCTNSILNRLSLIDFMG